MTAKDKSLRSPLGKVRGLGSAKSGTEHWIKLRLTALALIPLTLYVLIGFVNNALAGGYSGARVWLQSPLSATFTIVMLLAGLSHGASGMKEVIEDYIHHEGAKLTSILAVKLTAFALAVLGVLSIAKIFVG